MLEQQKMLYDSKLEQLDQLHQQKQVSLVRNGQSCQKQVSLVRNGQSCQKQVSLVRNRSVLCQNLHVHVYLLLMNLDLLAQEFESELGLLRQQREVSVRTANS